eukprot:c12779_g1_i1 orf=189-557(-)
MINLLITIVGTILFAGVLAALYLFPRAFKGPKKAGVVRTTESEEHEKFFTASEVSKHNTATDCWIIIKNKVYNVTPYVEEHPGGYAILNHAGGDSTEGFYGPQHASRVFDMVDEFYIGDLTL